MEGVWQHFSDCESGGHKCKYCGVVYAPSTSGHRLQHHIASLCPKATKELVTALSKSSSASETSDEAAPPKKKGRLDDLYPRLPCASKTELDELWTNAVLHGGIPFAFADNPFLRDFMESLSGGFYLPPCSKTLATTLLDSAYEKQFASLKESLKKASAITILTDGW
jgi:hypothetical protein